QAMAELECGTSAIAAASGMAAITQTLLALLNQGDRVLAHRCIYTSTAQFFWEVLNRFGVTVDLTDLRDLAALPEALGDGTALVYGETITNPNMEIFDIRAVADIAHQAGAKMVIDNTFASAYLCRPLELGADVVVQSATKYLSGHGDVLGGVTVCRDEEIARQIHHVMTIHGGALSPVNGAMILRGLKTLPVRMDAHCRNAGKLAEFLERHPKVTRVRYPGLSDDTEHATASRQMDGFSGILGLHFLDGQGAADAFLTHIKLAKPWASLGDVQTLVGVCNEWEPNAIPGAYARVSVGLENIDDIIADFDQALAKV
ncbi:MAG: aminotransferase class V-fold PLP-dependent enzyme, partial [Phycisphaerae bacterium]|nr:aminotransferase class V-fold PLP-dependent enzyme [Phycisphaerae bacterium]